MKFLKDANVLIVDDELDLCEMLAFEFKLHGSRVLTAADGESALNIVQSNHVDAVVSDIQMANGSGTELLEKLRAQHVSEPSVVFITAYDTAISPLDAYDRGAEGILGKPFPLNDLIERVRRILTPPQERWAVQPEQDPVCRLALNLESLEAAAVQGLLAVGRGGLALVADGPLDDDVLTPGCAVELALTVSTGELPAISGMGTLRWSTKKGGRTAYGVEFDYLTDDCREGVLHLAFANPGRAYIPILC